MIIMISLKMHADVVFTNFHFKLPHIPASYSGPDFGKETLFFSDYILP